MATVVADDAAVDLLDDPHVARREPPTAIPQVSAITELQAPPSPTLRVPVEAPLPSDAIKKAVTKLEHTNAATLRRVHTLRLVMAGLEGVTFDEAANLLGVSPKRLQAWLQETESVPKSKDRLLGDLHEILRLVQELVPRAHTGRWMRLPIPGLGGATPYDALVDGRSESVLSVAQRYADSSFV